MTREMKNIREAIMEGQTKTADFEGLPLPEWMLAVTTHKDEVTMFEGLESWEKDPKKSLHLDQVPVPEVGPNEALVAIMASSINFNTVWSAIFEPLPTFLFLERNAKKSPWDSRHNLPYHILGSDASGVVLKVGPGVNLFKPGDEVTIHCNYVDMQAPDGHDDSMLDPDQRIWGFETNFGGLGGFALQYVLNTGAFPICVVSSQDKVRLCETIGARWVIDRNAEGYRFWNEDGSQNQGELRRFGKQIRDMTGGEDPDVVYEHPGHETFAASVFIARPGGQIVTCASTSGYNHEYDNRYLWMNKKRIIGSHFANYREAWEANRLVCKRAIHPLLSETYPLAETGEAAYRVHHNTQIGKIGVLCLAPEEGLGVTDEEGRARHIGQINLYRNAAKGDFRLVKTEP